METILRMGPVQIIYHVYRSGTNGAGVVQMEVVKAGKDYATDSWPAQARTSKERRIRFPRGQPTSDWFKCEDTQGADERCGHSKGSA